MEIATIDAIGTAAVIDLVGTDAGDLCFFLGMDRSGSQTGLPGRNFLEAEFDRWGGVVELAHCDMVMAGRATDGRPIVAGISKVDTALGVALRAQAHIVTAD